MNVSRHLIAAALISAALISPFAAFAQNTDIVAPVVSPEQTPATEQTPAAEQVPAVVQQEPTPIVDGYADAPEAVRTLIANVDALSAEGKWLSAWNALSEADPDNKDGFILSKKIRIALDGYAQNAMHLVFAFIDLPEGTDLTTIREMGSDGLEPVEFDPWTYWQAMEAAGGAAPPVLSRNLGDYYYVVHKTYQGQWFEQDDVVLGRAIEQYDRALAYDYFTPESLLRHAELLTSAGNPAGAESILLRALAIDPTNTALIIPLIDSYASQGKGDEAFARIDALLAEEKDAQVRYDTMTKGIQVALQTQNGEKTEFFLKAMETEFAGDYLAPFIRHMIAVNSGDEQTAGTIADALYAMNPHDPQIVSTLLSTWLSVGKAQEGIDFVDRSIVLATDDASSLAILHFYRALVISEVAKNADDLQLAMEDLDKAEAYFIAAGYPSDHGVFQTIAQLRGEWTPAPVEPAATSDIAPATDTAAATGETAAPSSSAPSN